MHARRTTFLLLVTLLTSACVAVPHDRAPAPTPRPGGLAPAADRAPAPLPTWPAPVEPAPREALTATEPRPGSRPEARPSRTPARQKARAAVEGPSSARRPSAHRPVPDRPDRPHLTPHEPGQPQGRRPGTTRAVPRAPQKSRTAPAGPYGPADARPPEMRRLCRQAESLRAPMGAADLCRGLYGR
ncbi:hypothetical protein [Streptomyces sp. NPDC056549]|uniref:hypothetical protein n=1 Tax=Streptomyces sp. NPDC056549 TaxID=3345864 RepID=UPI0036A3A5E2